MIYKKKGSERSNCWNLVFFSQSLYNDLGSTLLFNIFLKSTLAHVYWRSPLKAFFNLLALSLVTRPTRTFNGSYGAWITSHLHMIYNPFYLSQPMPCYFSVFFTHLTRVTIVSAWGAGLDVPTAIPATTALTSCSKNAGSEHGFGVVVGAIGGGLSSGHWPPVALGSNTSS